MSRFAPTRRALVAGLAAAGSLACAIPAATAPGQQCRPSATG